jgi:hypothetical protein
MALETTPWLGLPATISMVADRYAEVFAAAGISALLYTTGTSN